MLTKGINEFTGTTGNDTFDATEDSTATATFSNLDKLDGGAGTDTLKIVQAAAVDTTAVVGATVTNIENINITSGAAVTTNTSTWTGATALTIAAGTNVTATAAATTDITAGASALAAGAGDEISINGGKNVTVTGCRHLHYWRCFRQHHRCWRYHRCCRCCEGYLHRNEFLTPLTLVLLVRPSPLPVVRPLK